MNFKNYTSQVAKNSTAVANKNNEANTVAVADHPASQLDLSYTHKTTFNAGYLVPVFQCEVYPHDVFTIDCNTLLKMSIPSAPTMDSPRYDVNFFFVPWKQVFPKFEDVIGTSYEAGQPDPATQVPSIDYSTISSNSSAAFTVNDLASYMNIPVGVDLSKIGMSINALPFRAYVKIWDDWYRDENLDELADFTNDNLPNGSITFNNEDWTFAGNTNPSEVQYGGGLLQVNRLKDYFASCLPFIQKGAIPTISTINTTAINEMLANVNGTASIDTSNSTNTNNPVNVAYTVSGSTYTDTNLGALSNLSNADIYQDWVANINNNTLQLNSNYSNGTGLGTFNITDLRTALVKQHQNELDARAGTRYYEKLLSYWGIATNPLAIGRSEYLGGWHDIVNINNVVQSAPATSSASTPTGTVAGLSITTGALPNSISFSADQYGIILGLVCVRTNITYSQGLPRLFTKLNNWDYYNPSFNGISEQPIYKYELYLDENGTTNNTQVFGYNQPFADLKYKPNVASGYLSANATDTYYNFYSYQNALSSSPTLSNAWMYYPRTALENTLLMNSSNQVENIHDFLADFYFKVSVMRVIPAYSVPGVNKI